MTEDTGAGTGTGPAVDDLVDYCHTQAGLLSGRIETMRAEADDLLTEIDEHMAELRGQLEEQTAATEGPDGPARPAGPDGTDLDLEAFEDLEQEVEEKQLLLEAKQTRMEAFQELATAYAELGDELRTEIDDGDEALTRVVQFEADRDAPAYFEERETMVEAAVDAQSAGAENDSDGDTE